MSRHCKLPHETNFYGYCRTIALSSSSAGYMARMVLRLGARSFTRCKQKAGEWYETGKINADEHKRMIHAIDTMLDLWDRGYQTHTVVTHKGTWDDLGDGRHRKVNHIKEV